MNPMPVLFVSHGSPMIALEDGAARRFLHDIGKSLARPRAILVASAHWETKGGTAVGLAARPETIHDFGGFPGELYELSYPAPGAPGVAGRAAALAEAAGFAVLRQPTRGIDHGAWIPLRLMYPEADIPVAQIALIHGGSPADHYRLGQALQPLREEGVLILGSGSATHNLFALDRAADGGPGRPWVEEFIAWLAERVAAGRLDDLLDYRRRAPHAVHNHPTEEHLLPLFVALGAAGEGTPVRRVHSSVTYGALAMDAFLFGADEAAAG